MGVGVGWGVVGQGAGGGWGWGDDDEHVVTNHRYHSIKMSRRQTQKRQQQKQQQKQQERSATTAARAESAFGVLCGQLRLVILAGCGLKSSHVDMLSTLSIDDSSGLDAEWSEKTW